MKSVPCATTDSKVLADPCIQYFPVFSERLYRHRDGTLFITNNASTWTAGSGSVGQFGHAATPLHSSTPYLTFGLMVIAGALLFAAVLLIMHAPGYFTQRLHFRRKRN